jgi:hypothetical protein
MENRKEVVNEEQLRIYLHCYIVFIIFSLMIESKKEKHQTEYFNSVSW